MIRWIPHAITAFRGLCGPLVLLVLLVPAWRGWAFWIFNMGAWSDLYDGFLARRLNAPPGIGEWLDPLADKVLAGCSWAGLWLSGWAPWWLCAALLSRYVGVLIAWLALRGRPIELKTSRVGMMAASYEGTSLGLLLFHGPWLGVHWPSVGVYVGLIAVALSFASAVGYLLQLFSAPNRTRPAPP